MQNGKLQFNSLPFAEPKKRGAIRFFSYMFGVFIFDSIVLTSLISLSTVLFGLASIFQKGLSSGLNTLLFGLALGGLAFWQWQLLNKSGTSPFKKLLKMQVLKYDSKINGYRKCTPMEYIARDIMASVYFPVSFAVLSLPVILGGSLAGSVRSMSMGDNKYDNSFTRDYRTNEVNKATAAGAAAGMALSYTLIQKAPWLLALHDTLMKTIVVSVTPEQVQHFSNGGTFLTEKEIVPFSQAA